MREDEIVATTALIGLLAMLIIIAIALTAGNIVNELLAPLPYNTGPIGAAIALLIFVSLLGKAAELLIRLFE